MSALPIVAYLRVSTDEQSASGLGLEAQRAAIEHYATMRGVELVAVHEDVCSSKVRPSQRPGWQAAVADAIEHGAAVAIMRLDRLGRDVRHVLEVIEDGPVPVVAVDVGIDGTTSVGRATWTMLAMAARLERDFISDRTREALAAKKARGARLGRPVRTPDELRQAAHALRGEGLSFRAVARELTARGLTPADLAPARVRAIVRSVELDHEAAAATRQED